MTAADHTPSGSTPCRRSPVRARWESITWPGKPTAYPCAHDHAHCDFIGCVEHIDGMHIDYRGDAIVHVGCDMCRPPADHTPSPATDGLREAVEALAASWSREADAGRRGNGHGLLVQTYDGHARELRAILAAHPAPDDEIATECEDGVFGSQDIADALGGRGPLSTIVGEWEPVEGGHRRIDRALLARHPGGQGSARDRER